MILGQPWNKIQVVKQKGLKKVDKKLGTKKRGDTELIDKELELRLDNKSESFTYLRTDGSSI